MTSNENDQRSTVIATTAALDVPEAPIVDLAAAGAPTALEALETAGAVMTPFVSTTALPGEVLAARRNELRWTLEEVSQRLKLAPRQITALEANDFVSLPGMASVRGFIRAYARLLELDPVPLLAMMSNEANPAVDPIVLRRPLPSRGFPGRRYAFASGHRRGSRRLSALALLVVVFVGVLAYTGHRHGLPTTNFDYAGVSALFDSPKDVTEPGTESVDQQVTAPVAPAIAEGKSIEPSRLLELKLREDAWVEISGMNGNKLVSRLMRAGTTERFDMSEPIILVVGNANGVDATLRGQPLNLRAVARDNVSKLSLK